MPLFNKKQNNLILTAFISILFSITLLLVMPILGERSKLAIFLFPCLGVFFVIMAIKPESALILILLTRAAIDPLITMTRSGDQQVGFGAGINLVVIILGIILFMKNKKNLKNLNIVPLWIIFLTISFIAVFYSPTPFRGFRLFLNFVTYMLMAFLPVLIIKDVKEVASWLKIILLSSIISVCYGDIQLIGNHASSDRIFSTFSHPNIFAFYLVLMIVITFYLIKSTEAKTSPLLKFGLSAYLINLVILLIFTKTRNAWFACWLIFIIYGWRGDKKIFWSALILPLIALLIPSVNERIFDLFHGNNISSISGLNSFAWRRRLWTDSLLWISQKPFLGYGLTSFMYYSRDFSKITFDTNMGAHNAYIEVLFEMGIIGLCSFCSVFLGTLMIFSKKILSDKKHSNSHGLEILAFAYFLSYIIICFGDNLNYYLVFNWYSWFFIGLMIASICQAPKQQN